MCAVYHQVNGQGKFRARSGAGMGLLMIDCLIIAILLLLVTAAARYLWKQHKNGGCCGGCAGCPRRGKCPPAGRKGGPK
uniref:FeoB-associated Cys-rich membrane protein n=1 Tax=Intestinibacillus massiliensis TaxID=1871029 RepID=UPI0038B339B1